ncbi:acetyltransferase (GNAT) family protein [Isoptericola sp. CG 20/1183]|uniref:Acetyltransferase (GNAT) family protein n=1 Tax=Isoptericola halotolerans TaxID=300560 RepID=A0ABX5EI27_9MICO|nr:MULTISPECIES: GNAT family N-acetyltransferase [Isoptericola]PRZ09326.1 acetyltransferase (GNAT) family protein [Isoptericola sp. CG 20/1183]PRZ10127.1 acetyltransferase (GNAT) family protein [Isoptericola halotolerans]
MTTAPTPAPQATWRIIDAPHGASLDAPEAWAYRGIAEVERECALDEFGHDDVAQRAIDVLVGMQDQRYLRRRRLVAVEDQPDGTPRVVGHAVLYLPQTSNEHLADGRVAVLPSHRRRGIGAQLAERLRQIAVAEGRTTAFAEVDFAHEPVPAEDEADDRVLVPPTGSGAVAADHPGMVLARRLGLRLELVSRRSVLELPLPDGAAERFAADARAAAGPDYRVHTWQDRTPEEWIEQYADLETRLTMDEPNADLDLLPERWDADRVRFHDAEHAAAGRGYVVTAAEHVPTGQLVAVTMLLFARDRPELSEQETTVVLPEHRGHRLGMLVKAVNLQAHARVRPATRRISTWNNENNPHMLAINVALGFRPAGGCAALQANVADVVPADVGAAPPAGG